MDAIKKFNLRIPLCDIVQASKRAVYVFPIPIGIMGGKSHI